MAAISASLIRLIARKNGVHPGLTDFVIHRNFSKTVIVSTIHLIFAFKQLKRKIMREKHEKLMTDLQRLLETQDFKSEKDIMEFMKQFTEHPIPSLPKEALTPQEQAQDLIFEARELDNEEGVQKIYQALRIDPDCIEAFEFLAELEPIPESAIAFYEKGIAIGRKRFDADFIKKHKGRFWGVHETRPFIRCLGACAECLVVMQRYDEAIAVFEEVLELNPLDNTGVRYILLAVLVHTGQYKKYLKYDKLFDDKFTATALYTRALYQYKIADSATKSANALRDAKKANKHVVKLLLASDYKPIFPTEYQHGSLEEAQIYLAMNKKFWQETEGAIDWLRKNSSAK
jgi:tetratricopeptide (TPR) repeat protein